MTLGYEKIDFLHLPTPLEKLNNISKDFGVNVYIKRDDLTGLGTGGNKLRKLEYFICDAKKKGATMVLTIGGAQTNHGRLTGAVAAKYGLKAAIVTDDPFPGEISANLLLDGIMDCPVYFAANMDIEKFSQDSSPSYVFTGDALFDAAISKVKAEWEAKGEKVYYIPMGGSNELGTLGYYDCAVELAKQVEELGIANPAPKVFCTVGSMGTYMGMQVGIKNEHLPLDLIGIGIFPRDTGIKNDAVEYYGQVKKFFNLDLDIAPDEFNVTDEYDWGDYNNPVKEVREAIYYMGRKEAIILDPCYTGKTFYGMLQMIKSGNVKPGENVILMHTGGIPGIYTKHHRVEFEKELHDYMHIL